MELSGAGAISSTSSWLTHSPAFPVPLSNFCSYRPLICSHVDGPISLYCQPRLFGVETGLVIERDGYGEMAAFTDVAGKQFGTSPSTGDLP